MFKPLCALILEDRGSDVELMLHELRQAEFDVDWRRVETEADYLAHLDPTWDVILADYSLPQFTALRALHILQERGLDIPFIVITGSISEEVAVECVLQGAADYLLKDRLARLGQAIEQALERKRLRTERRQAEETLRESEARYKRLADSITDIFSALDKDLRFTYWNKATEALTGVLAEDAIGKCLPELFPSVSVIGRAEEFYREVLNTQRPQTLMMEVPSEGQLLFFEINAYPSSGGLSVFVRNITQRKQMEEALWQTKLVVEHSPVVLFRSRAEEGLAPDRVGDWPIDFVSENVGQFGYSAEELLSGAVSYASLVHPDDLPRMAQEIQAFAARGEDSFRQEYRLRTKDGQVRWVDDRTVIVRGPDGRVTHYQGVLIDITEHKRLEEQFLQAQKMESVGRLAGGVAHDFNNLLTVINLYSDMALRSLEPSNPPRQDLEEIHKAGDRAAQLTRQLLAFSRRQVLEMHTLNLNEVLQGLAKMLPRLVGEDITLELKFAPDLGYTRADPGQIEQVVVNLAVNARDAMPDGGRLTLETANVTLDRLVLRRHPDAVVGDYVMLAISDTGTGMTEEVKAHLFEPFFTTKGLGKGTGLGLATVYGIIKQHQGHIWVYSEPGLGSTFKIYLPRVEEEPAKLSRLNESATLPRGTGTVLVVEDEPAVRGVAVRVLSGLGYRVLEASNGLEALQVAAAWGQAIHLLLTDVVMPEMNGKVLSEQLTAFYPGVKVLFISGYTDETVSQRGVLEEGVSFLQKPFPPAGLAHKVREVLDK
jgi:PAS domain S-box-containing protein